MEDLGLDRKKAEELIAKYISNDITRYHLLESEAIMKALARHFGEDEERWGIIGLLHDIDWDLTKDNVAQHCLKCAEILKEAGATDFLITTIQSHGYEPSKRTTRLQHALAAAETLTGLIVASALVQPDKKLASVRPESVLKKFKNKAFAAKCNREIILECEKIGLSLGEFLIIGLRALQSISSTIGL